MPRYFFHCAGSVQTPDHEGTELANAAAAQLQAIAFAGEVLRDRPDELRDAGNWRVDVTDEHDNLIFTVVTLTIEAPPHAKRQLAEPANDALPIAD